MTSTLERDTDSGYERLERALTDVVRRIYLRSMARLTPDGQRLDKAAYHLMGRLEDSGDLRLSDLAALVQLDTSTVSRQVRGLEDAGMVSRRPDPDDGRAARVDLTAAGRRMFAAMRRDRHDLMSAAMSHWSERDRRQLATLMHRLATDLSAALTDPDTPRTRTREATR